MEWHSGKSAVSFGKSFVVVVFCLGSCPVFCLVCCFLLTKRKSGWGICGSSWLLVPVCFLVYFDLPSFDGPYWVLVQMSFLTAYAHVRTEPQSNIGQTRGKKN